MKCGIISSSELAKVGSWSVHDLLPVCYFDELEAARAKTKKLLFTVQRRLELIDAAERRLWQMMADGRRPTRAELSEVRGLVRDRRTH